MEQNGLLTWKFWHRALENMMGVAIISFSTLLTDPSINWGSRLQIVLYAIVASLALSVTGSRIGDSTDPSFFARGKK